jgi:hypothetical protein
MIDDFDFIIVAISNSSQDILQKNKAKQEALYERIAIELRGVQQALHSSRTVCIVPLLSEEPKLEDEPTQLYRLVDATKARLHRAQEEKEQATMALKQAQEEMVEKLWFVQKEKEDLQANF